MEPSGTSLSPIWAAGHAFDFALTNANQLQGIRCLAESLGCTVRIHNVNLDAGFSLPAGRFGAVSAFGLLYHLKNPFGVLESLARQCRYLFPGTRIARFTPDLSTSDTASSITRDALHDERAYCVPRSRFPDPMSASTQLLRGTMNIAPRCPCRPSPAARSWNSRSINQSQPERWKRGRWRSLSSPPM